MNDPIESYLRDHLKMCRELLGDAWLDDKEAAPDLDHLEQVYLPVLKALNAGAQSLTERYGELGFERIHKRAAQLVTEVLGGGSPPPLAQAQRDPWSVVEADIIAENLVKEFRGYGVRPSSDAQWEDKLEDRHETLLAHGKKITQELQARAAAKRAAPQPAPVKSLDQLEAVVTSAVEKRPA